MIDPNTPAFPHTDAGGNHFYGLTLLQHFALNAPHIPEWFEVPVDPLTHYSVKKQEMSESDWEIFTQWKSDPIFELSDSHPHLKAFQDKQELHNKNRHEVLAKNIVDRYFAWRKFYAQKMLETL